MAGRKRKRLLRIMTTLVLLIKANLPRLMQRLIPKWLSKSSRTSSPSSSSALQSPLPQEIPAGLHSQTSSHAYIREHSRRRQSFRVRSRSIIFRNKPDQQQHQLILTRLNAALDQGDSCAVCRELHVRETIVATMCGHTFCYDCLQTWKRSATLQDYATHTRHMGYTRLRSTLTVVNPSSPSSSRRSSTSGRASSSSITGLPRNRSRRGSSLSSPSGSIGHEPSFQTQQRTLHYFEELSNDTSRLWEAPPCPMCRHPLSNTVYLFPWPGDPRLQNCEVVLDQDNERVWVKSRTWRVTNGDYPPSLSAIDMTDGVAIDQQTE